MSFQIYFKKSVVGSVLTGLSGFFFFLTCMLLPLVGPAGSRSTTPGKNQLVFLAVLALTFVLAALATASKLIRRSEDQSPRPLWSMALCGACFILFVLQLSGALAI